MRDDARPDRVEARETGAAAPAAGWEQLAELTGGIDPAQVPALREARSLEVFYPLLHALVGRSPRDFFVRVAALECLVEAELPAFSSSDLAETLFWLDAPAREMTLAALRREGWLVHEPAAGTRVSDAGRWAHDVLAFLRRRQEESELLPTVAGLSYALDIGGMDPVHHLASLRSRLVALRQEIEDARASQSEVVMRRTQGRLADALDLSERIRAVLDRVPAANAAARRVARDVHDLLSRLHGAAADLHAAVTEVGRQYLRLTAGLTTEQVVRALMGRTLAELAALGAEALRAVHAPPPLLDTDVVAAAAEQHALRDRPPASELAWEEPAAAPRADEAVELPAEVAAFVAELADLAAARQARPLHALVPRGDPSESYLRASLLSLVGGGSGGAGVAGSLGALDLAVAAEGDGWPEDLPDGGPLARLTPGRVGPGDGGGG